MVKLHRMDDPTIYSWTLDSNSTRYDYPRAWPSADVLHIQFSILAFVNLFVATGVLIFLIAYWKSPTVNGNPFNLYIFFVALPDFLASFFCFLTCAMSAPKSAFFSERMCGFQAFYLCFSFTTNAWLNGVIAYQVHKLLRYSNIRRRYTPPTKKQVCTHAAVVYTYAITWGLINSFGGAIPKLPHEAHLYYGFACSGMEYDRQSALFFFFGFIPLYLGLPLCYAVYVVWDIWWRNLLPASGLRRNISIFLMRLCFLYFLIWAPFMILYFIGDFVIVNAWIQWSGAALSHFQGIISVCFYMTNEDINKAVWSVICCRKSVENCNEQEGLQHSTWANLTASSWFPSWKFFSAPNDLVLRDESKLHHLSDESSVRAFPLPMSGDLSSAYMSSFMNTIKEENDTDVEESKPDHPCQDPTCMVMYSSGNEDICTEYESSKMSETADETEHDFSDNIEIMYGDTSPEKRPDEVELMKQKWQEE